MKRIVIILLAALVVIAGSWAYKWESHARTERQAKQCGENLYMLASCKEQVELRLGLNEGDPVTEQQAAAYVENGIMLQCPSGGKYSLNPVGQPPTCSLAESNGSHPGIWWHNFTPFDLRTLKDSPSVSPTSPTEEESLGQPTNPPYSSPAAGSKR